MATIKEVKITRYGQVVTPVVLTDSIIKLDGTKLMDIISELTKNIMPIN